MKAGTAPGTARRTGQTAAHSPIPVPIGSSGVIANDNDNDNSRFYFAQRPRVPGTAQDGAQKNLDRA